MKDYRLSEVKEICKKYHLIYCNGCPFAECKDHSIHCKFKDAEIPYKWEIESKTPKYRDAQKTLLKEYLNKAKLIAERL